MKTASKNRYQVTYNSSNYNGQPVKTTWIVQENEVEGVRLALRRQGHYDVRIMQLAAPGEPKPKSKAEIQREKEARETFRVVLGAVLENFRDLYLEQSYQYEKRQAERALGAAVVAMQEATGEHAKYWAEKRVERAQKRLALDSALRLDAYTEAAKSYAEKFEKLVDKLLEYGFTRHLKVQNVRNEDPRELSFLVHENGRVLHARTILAWGPIVRPHYRFITTERAA